MRSRRERLFEQQRGLCHWCKQPMTLRRKGNQTPPVNFATFEHVIRRADGGGNGDDNVVLACRKCNNERHSDPHLRKPKGSVKAHKSARRQSERREMMVRIFGED